MKCELPFPKVQNIKEIFFFFDPKPKRRASRYITWQWGREKWWFNFKASIQRAKAPCEN